MKKSRTILAATDFSATSREAMAVALDLARSTQAHLHLVTVIPDPALTPWSIDAGPTVVNLEKNWRDHATSQLKRALAETGLDEAQGSMSVLMGDAATEIVNEARARHAQVIVLGTHGHGRVARLLMGSVAGKVVRKADRPVLIVPHPSLEHLQPAPESTEAVTA